MIIYLGPLMKFECSNRSRNFDPLNDTTLFRSFANSWQLNILPLFKDVGLKVFQHVCAAHLLKMKLVAIHTSRTRDSYIKSIGNQGDLSSKAVLEKMHYFLPQNLPKEEEANL